MTLLPCIFIISTLLYAFSYEFIDLRQVSKPTEDNDKWLPSVFGVWQDSGSKFTGYLPDVDDEVFNYGPVRLWASPVHRTKYSKFVVM